MLQQVKNRSKGFRYKLNDLQNDTGIFLQERWLPVIIIIIIIIIIILLIC